MDKIEFSKIRGTLGKTQKKLAQLLCVSVKAIQSFEQGWRDIPPNIERQILFLYVMNRNRKTPAVLCWDVMKCPVDRLHECPAWEFQCGHLCWFISGTMCYAEEHKSWEEKITICRKCKVFESVIDL